jgi:hypothetical protein
VSALFLAVWLPVLLLAWGGAAAVARVRAWWR